MVKYLIMLILTILLNMNFTEFKKHVLPKFVKPNNPYVSKSNWFDCYILLYVAYLLNLLGICL